MLDAAEEFPEISDLLSRYDTLDAAHSDLIQRQTESAIQNEEERHALQQFIREKSDLILGYNNVIAELQKASEKTSERVIAEQSVSDRQMQIVAERTLQLGQVMMACENIHQRCCDRSSVARKPLKTGDGDPTAALKEKLQFVRDYLTDLTAITRGWKVPPPNSLPVDRAPPTERSTAGPSSPMKAGFTSEAHNTSVVRPSFRGGASHPSSKGDLGASPATHTSVSRHSVSTGSEDTLRQGS